MSEVGWYDLDALPALQLSDDMRGRIKAALRDEGVARFEGGR
jgi:hypothetical protein